MCCLAGLPAAASAATVSGRVFNDYNTNGVYDTNPDNGAVDVGVGGLTINAYAGTDTLIDHAVTGDDGTYSLDLPATKVRLELELVPPWWPSRYPAMPGSVRSDDVFVDASSAQTVDFAIHKLNQYSVDNPTLFWPTQWAGPPDAPACQAGDTTDCNPNVSEIAIRGAPYFSKEPDGQVNEWDSLTNKVSLATFGQVGTVFGLAMDQSTGDLYAGAYQKRFAGLKDGPGAIFKIASDGSVTEFTQVPDAGTDQHPSSFNIEDWVTCEGANANDSSTLTKCDFSWTDVGKIGLGDVAIDPQDQNLYTVNLNDKKLYRFPLTGSAARARGKRHAHAADLPPAAAVAIPNPACASASATTSATNWRPFAAAFDWVNDQLYVGGVCSAETSQNRAFLRAVVYRVDNPTSAPTFTKVLDFPLDYTRNSSAMTPCNSPNFCAWQPWPTVASTGGNAPTSNTQNGVTINENNNPSYPQLTAITFADDGSMILGLRDLIGDMGGVRVDGEIGTGSGQSGYGPMLHGDMLRAGANPDGTFSLENNGIVAGLTSAGKAQDNWGYGAGVGPGGYHFYSPAPLVTGLHAYPYPYQGGLTLVPGFTQVVATSIHVRDPQANGLLWRSVDTTGTDDGLQNFVTPASTNWTGFAKSNGLGDLTAYTGVAPVQIGNRLWYDLNGNGLQDADEPPVTDTIVELVDANGNVIASTKTDSQGEYVFNIQPGTSYTVRVPLDQPSLQGWVPTVAFAGDNRRIDSNGRDVNGNSDAHVRPHGPGQNDFSYDFGFSRPPTPPIPEPTPQPPSPEPTPTPQPPSAGTVERTLVLVKYLVHEGANHELQFSMIVRDNGAGNLANIRVCDRLPGPLTYLSATKLGRTLIGREVCWRIATLTSGQAQALNVTTQMRAGLVLGVLLNCAQANGTSVPALPHGRRHPLRTPEVCAAVRHVRAPPVTG